MKTMFGCSLASVMGLMLMVGIHNRSLSVLGPGYWKGYPRLDLPTLNNRSHSHREAVIHVSLSRNREWIFEEGKVSDIDLEGSLARRVDAWKTLGCQPSIRVRIAAHEEARHFLRLHQAATSVGIEEFAVAGFLPRDR